MASWQLRAPALPVLVPFRPFTGSRPCRREPWLGLLSQRERFLPARTFRGRRSRGVSPRLALSLAIAVILVKLLLTAHGHSHGHHWHRWWRRKRHWWPSRERLALMAALLLAWRAAQQKTKQSQPRRRRSRPLKQPNDTSRDAQMKKLKTAVREGDALRAAILLETWGQGWAPLTRADLQVLLEEAARFAPVPDLLRALAEQLAAMGVPLDWSLQNDCRGNFGRYALDAALEAVVQESRSENAALTLLNIGQRSNQGDTSQLDADPLLRVAAAQGMTRLVERLVQECGADVNAKDPRFGSIALDRAVDAGKEQTALKLLQLGADASCGKGVDYLLTRASPQVRGQLPLAKAPKTAPVSDITEDEFQALRKLQSEEAALEELKGKRLSKVQLAQLLEEAARRAVSEASSCSNSCRSCRNWAATTAGIRQQPWMQPLHGGRWMQRCKQQWRKTLTRAQPSFCFAWGSRRQRAGHRA
ncbi:unnamed protein product [Effrenium voratum]|uniref:Ankyrin repeat domain-containing protein n=1 Tax=Effrenium voratum TaxID=2562239 RepID=A0AA36NLG5_9DINO|nr:unnamed protein product [Effrenium voratum]